MAEMEQGSLSQNTPASQPQNSWLKPFFTLIVFQLPIIAAIAIVMYLIRRFEANSDTNSYIENARKFYLLRTAMDDIRIAMAGISAIAALIYIIKKSGPEEKFARAAFGFGSIAIATAALLMIIYTPIEGGMFVWLFAEFIAALGGFICLIAGLVFAFGRGSRKDLLGYTFLVLIWLALLFYLPAIVQGSRFG